MLIGCLIRALVCVGSALLATGVPLSAQRPAGSTRPEPPPQGQRIEARDGDIIVVENDARVSIVRRQAATVRIVIDQSRRMAIVLADHAFGSRASDGLVDQSWRFELASGTWPIEPRWEGAAAIEEATSVGFPLPRGLTLALPQGRIRFVQAGTPMTDADGLLAVITYSSFGGADGNLRPFDEAERYAMTAPTTSRSFGPAAVPGGPARAGTATVGATVVGGAVVSSPPQGAAAPVRPGGHIPAPRKIRHVDPVMPEAARAARVLGIVIVELTIDADGAVHDVRVLRSIPLLDDAAVAAARQWMYEPTLVNGQAVAAIITATVEFKMQ